MFILYNNYNVVWIKCKQINISIHVLYIYIYMYVYENVFALYVRR